MSAAAAAPEKSPSLEHKIFEFGIKFTCDSCYHDISRVIRIRCATCEEIDLCISCFRSGVEIKGHHANHSYFVIDLLNYPLFLNCTWRADEEIALLEACRKYGLGNWTEVYKCLPGRSAADCKDHYIERYLNSTSFPLPEAASLVSVGPDGISTFRFSSPPSSAEPPAAAQPDPQQTPSSCPANHVITGYMPLRGDFDVEVENEFEHLVKDLSFGDSQDANGVQDSEQERELKIAILRHYCSVLDRREERKAFALKRNFPLLSRLQKNESEFSPEKKALLESHRKFARFLSPGDFELFLGDLLLEQQLQRRIRQCQAARKPISHFPAANGITSDLSGQDFSASSAGSSRSNSPFIDGSAQQKVRRRAGVPIDLTDAEGVELLSVPEIELCSVLRLLPKVYLTIKEQLLREQSKIGYIKRGHARSIIKIDVNKTSKIYDFFVSAGWIRSNREDPNCSHSNSDEVVSE